MADKVKQAVLAELPSVNDLLLHPQNQEAIAAFGRDAVKFAARAEIDRARAHALKTGEVPVTENIVLAMGRFLRSAVGSTLIPVINGTGIVLHTNLGRAPLGDSVVEEIRKVASGYSNLEFDLETGRRGHRSVHVREMMKILTGAEDVAVVNNNAAGLVLALGTLAGGKEVIISRGELIEIGGSFRLPDIMATSGAKMVEIGTTNRTRLSDYEQALTPDTGLIFKAHTSNFLMSGFTEEVSVRDLADFSKQHRIPFLYDIGSGLLRKPQGIPLEKEPDVQSAIRDGADLVAFSGDKLLGGPQAGIIAGREELVKKLHRAPLMRALRVCKLTYAALSAVCRQYLRDADLKQLNPTFAALEQSLDVLSARAAALEEALRRHGVKGQVVESTGRCGGGTLPGLELPSRAVEVLLEGKVADSGSTAAEHVFTHLLRGNPPVLGILREGKLLFDVLTLKDDQLGPIAERVATVLKEAGDIH